MSKRQWECGLFPLYTISILYLLYTTCLAKTVLIFIGIMVDGVGNTGGIVVLVVVVDVTDGRTGTSAGVVARVAGIEPATFRSKVGRSAG